MGAFFTDRGYPAKIVEGGMSKASRITQHQALVKKRNDSNSRTPLVLTYHKTTQRIANAVRANMSILLSHESTKRIFGADPVITAYRREKNLKNHLVRSRLPTQASVITTPGTTRCKQPRCKTCAHVSSDDVVGPKGTWHIRGQFTCATTNVIYGLTCTRCCMVYIGETKRRLADRFTEHLRSIRLKTAGLRVAHHFNIADHTADDLHVCVLKSCRDEKERKLMEERIIFKLGTLHPNGINATFRSFPKTH